MMFQLDLIIFGSTLAVVDLGSNPTITREIMGNVPLWMAVAFYALVTAACLWAAFKFARRFWQHRQGRHSETLTTPDSVDTLKSHDSVRDSMGLKLWATAKYLTFHQQLLRDRYAGIAHLLLFYGFTILFIGTCLVFLEHDTPLHFFYGRFYLIASLIIDLGGIMFLVGLVMFLCRRMFGNSQRILRRFYVAALLWILLAIGITGFLLEGSRIAIDRPEFEKWSVAGNAVAAGLNAIGIEGESAERLHRFWWGFHAVVCIAFFALLPWRFFSHIVYAPISWAFRTSRPRSALRPATNWIGNRYGDASANLQLRANSAAPNDSPQTATSIASGTASGATEWDQFPWLDLLQADACTTCGRCNEVCPAHAAGKPLRPREIVLGIRESMNHSNQPLTDFIDDDAVWSCTTCGACNEACPVGIEVYDKIVELRRGKVESGEIPDKAARAFYSSMEQANPFDRPDNARMNWAAGLTVPVAKPSESIELLYWIGCAGSFDPDGQPVSRAMVKILNHLGISYRVLGKRERCTGDPARRMGEEGLFQELAQSNIEMLKEHGVARILTHCPHCFNTFKNEYPQLTDINFEVEHHSQFLARMIDKGKLKASGEIKQKVTFHDPCYLGRGNGETEAPRKILAALPMVELVEMPRHGCNSSCCGAGGGSLWLDIKGDDRIENQRANEAADTGAELVVTGCPFCKTMLAAGQQSFENEIIDIVDLAELVVRAEGL